MTNLILAMSRKQKKLNALRKQLEEKYAEDPDCEELIKDEIEKWHKANYPTDPFDQIVKETAERMKKTGAVGKDVMPDPERKQKSKNKNKNKNKLKNKVKSKMTAIERFRLELQNDKDLTPEAVETKVQEFVESLEDRQLFSKKLQQKRQEIEKRYPQNEDGNKLVRLITIRALMDEKETFLKGAVERTAVPELKEVAEDATLKTPEQIEREKQMRYFDPSKMPIVREIPTAAPETDEKKTTTETETETEAKTKVEEPTFTVDPPDVLLRKYYNELTERFKDEKLVAAERARLIDNELRTCLQTIQREIQIVRKLKRESKMLNDKLTKLPKYADHKNDDALEAEILSMLNRRKRELDKHFLSTGIDPFEHDKISVDTCQKLVDEYNKLSKQSNFHKQDKDQLFNYFKMKYENFVSSYNIIVKYLVYMNSFDMDAFKRYLVQCRVNVVEKNTENPYVAPKFTPGTTEEKLKPSELKWLENQGFYVSYLSEEFHKKNKGVKLSQKYLTNLRTHVIKTLTKEMLTFKSDFKKTSDKLKTKQKQEDTKLLQAYITKISDHSMEINDDDAEDIIAALDAINTEKKEQEEREKEIIDQTIDELPRIDMIESPIVTAPGRPTEANISTPATATSIATTTSAV